MRNIDGNGFFDHDIKALNLMIGDFKHHMLGIKYLKSIGYTSNDILITENKYVVSDLDVDDFWISISGVPDLYTINDGKYWEIKRLYSKRNLKFENSQIVFLNELPESNILIFKRNNLFVQSLTYEELIKNSNYIIDHKRNKMNLNEYELFHIFIKDIINIHFMKYDDYLYVINPIYSHEYGLRCKSCSYNVLAGCLEKDVEIKRIKCKSCNNNIIFKDYILYNDIIKQNDFIYGNEEIFIIAINNDFDGEFINFKITFNDFLKYIKNENMRKMKKFILDNGKDSNLTDIQIQEIYAKKFDYIHKNWKFDKLNDKYIKKIEHKYDNNIDNDHDGFKSMSGYMIEEKNKVELDELLKWKNELKKDFEIFDTSQDILNEFF